MTDDMKREIHKLRSKKMGVNKIARTLGLKSYSVRRVLDPSKYLTADAARRRARGAKMYRCSVCKETGHNKTTHGVPR